ncbi:MAG: 2-oxoacid:acceptor oxidoreductase family protein [Deltaproteobacteria bacterium]|nr:2-oxoacid:acceptor oxidoreductase family protein [Deltaproteobacteria bacterium]MBW2068394.1 2-oxoacid:acceptor oxidoreductase family protein [Deltaproteobacteria bacterium]
MKRDRVEVRWHGRGGQGAVTAAMILAEAAYIEGYKGVTAAPFFGAERRGAPVIATNRFGPRPIKTFSLVNEPDIVVVLDESLLSIVDVTSGLKTDGLVLINSTKAPNEYEIADRFNVATSDAFHCAIKADLTVAGNVLFNTTILGGFAKATGLISMDSIEKALRKHFRGEAAEKNVIGAKLAFESTQILRTCTIKCA